MSTKSRILLTLSITPLWLASAQVNWESDNGPWFSLVEQLSVGLKDGQVVLYAADSSETSLMKSVDRGETWTHSLSVPGGYVNTVGTSLSNADIVYAGVRHPDPEIRGIYKSTNGGSSWDRLYRQPESFVHSRIAVDAANPMIVWVGCAVHPARFPALYRTTNGGDEWRGFDIGIQQDKNNLTVTGIALSVTHTGYIWMSAQSGNQENAGIWRSLSAGDDWYRTVEGIDASNYDLAGVAISHENPDVLYTANMRFGRPEIRTYKTTNGTGECKWEKQYQIGLAPYTFTDIAVSPLDDSLVFVTTGRYADGIGVLLSTDGGENWNVSDMGIRAKELRTVVGDPLSRDRIYVGGFGSCYLSQDRGNSWRENNTGMLFVPPQGFAVKEPFRFVSGNYTVSRKDGSQGEWQVVKSSYGTMDDWIGGKIAVNRTNPYHVVAGGGIGRGETGGPAIYLSSDAGVEWTQVYSFVFNDWNRITCIEFDPKDPRFVYATRADLCNQQFGDRARPIVLKSQSGGWDWEEILTSQPSNAFVEFAIETNTEQAPSEVLYVGGNRFISQGERRKPFVWKSTDYGQNWFDASKGIEDAWPMTSLIEDPSALDVLYMTTELGFYRTTNGGQEWVRVGENIAEENLTSAVAHPFNNNVLYVGSAAGRVYRSRDLGDHWQDISNGLNCGHVSLVDLDPTEGNQIFAATDSGVFRVPHVWTGEIAASTTWKSGETYLVESTLVVPQGKVLIIEHGTSVQFFEDAKLLIEGRINAVGTWNSHISLSSGDQWQGIELGVEVDSRFEYVDIAGAKVGIYSPHDCGLHVGNCSIQATVIGISLFSYSHPGQSEQSEIIGNTINAPIVGIFLDFGVSDVTIKNNLITGSMDGKYGMSFISAFPVGITGNRIQNYGGAGVYCFYASPTFVDGENGGHNCVRDNVFGYWIRNNSNPVLGIDDQYYIPGLNSIIDNSEFQIVVSDNCLVFAQWNFFGSNGPSQNAFDVDQTSKLVYEPWITEDPNECESSSKQSIAENSIKDPETGDGPFENWWNSGAVKQALRLRLQRQHVNAITSLKNLVAGNQSNVSMARWALQELIANYQMLRNPSGNNLLSPYLRIVLSSQLNSEIKRAARDVLPSALLHERNVQGTIAALNESIQLYPGTSSELFALYSKVSLAVNVLHDLTVAQSTLQVMESRYPSDELTSVAALLVEHASGGAIKAGTPRASTKSRVKEELPREFALAQNYPNPFNPSTIISYAMPEAAHATIAVYDILGREVASLVNEEKEAGYHQVAFDASKLASGVYFYKLQANSFTQVRKMLLMK